MKKVSVIVPCYNSGSYIERSVNSLVNQTLNDIEIILIDDGSTDDTLTKLTEYQKKYKDKIKVVALEKNGGLGNARNVGLKKATGEYIGFVDSDDYVDKEMFEEMYDKAKNTNSEIVECDFIWEYPNKNRVDYGKEYSKGKDMLINVRVMVCNKIYKREWISKINPQFAVGLKYEDVLFTYQYVPYVTKIEFIHKNFYHYIQRSTSLANHQTKRVREIYEILTQVESYYKKKKIYDCYREELEYLFTRYILGSSYKRACKIKDKKTRKEVLKEGWIFLNKKYPNWKKNQYLKKGLKNRYFKMLNYAFYNMNSILFR